jgi:hypothetical protein
MEFTMRFSKHPERVTAFERRASSLGLKHGRAGEVEIVGRVGAPARQAAHGRSLPLARLGAGPTGANEQQRTGQDGQPQASHRCASGLVQDAILHPPAAISVPRGRLHYSTPTLASWA